MNEFVMVELLLTAVDSGDKHSMDEAAEMLRNFAEVVAPDEVSRRPIEEDKFRPASAGVAVSGTEDSDSAENIATTDIPTKDSALYPDDEDSIPTNRIDT